MQINDKTALSVSDLNRQIRYWLENEIGELVVTGELSNLSRPSSGHLYFTLKDTNAQLRCVYFRNYHTPFNKSMQDGQQVLVRGILSVYEPRGDYQFVVHAIKEAGFGELYKRFEELKLKLHAQGLFEESLKRPLPRYPACIGIITSRTGAALQDILTTLARRYPLAIILVYPSDVQGKNASTQLIAALEMANQSAHADVLILARGGGSIEDLWAFNDEALAYAIRNSSIPVISGVGHETDFTIADFVADLRAATPTAAAQAASPDASELFIHLNALARQMLFLTNRLLQQKQLFLLEASKHLLSPKQLLHKHWQTLDFLEHRLRQTIQILYIQRQAKLDRLSLYFDIQKAKACFAERHFILQSKTQRLLLSTQSLLNAQQQRLKSSLSLLQNMNPLATLERGYAVVVTQNQTLRDSNMVKINDKIDILLAKGRLRCKIIDKQ